MGDDTIIEVKDLTAGYGDEVILKGISFKVTRGEIFVILGGSGCGKSTLLKHMIGLYPLVKGEILIGGENLDGATGEDRERILRRFGVMYQSGALFGSMTLRENIELALEEFTTLSPDARKSISGMKLKLVGVGVGVSNGIVSFKGVGSGVGGGGGGVASGVGTGVGSGVEIGVGSGVGSSFGVGSGVASGATSGVVGWLG